jgi:hypothetical protein
MGQDAVGHRAGVAHVGTAVILIVSVATVVAPRAALVSERALSMTKSWMLA